MKLSQIKKSLTGNQPGFSIIEVLIAIAIISIIAVGYSSGMVGASRAAIQTDQMDTGRVLAQHQMEYVKNQTFVPKQAGGGEYIPVAISQTTFPGYAASITVDTVNYDTTIQKITVVITAGGRQVSRLEDYKTQ